MVQPLTADFLTGTVTHSLIDIVSILIGIERIQPYEHCVFVLRFELRLTVDGPGKIPVVDTVLNGDDTTGRYLS